MSDGSGEGDGAKGQRRRSKSGMSGAAAAIMGTLPHLAVVIMAIRR
jgi:hypothetical protein